MSNYRPAMGLTPAVKIILVINVLIFLAINFSGNPGELTRTLGLHLPQSDYFHWYQYLTHMFTQEGLSHIFFNMFAVFMFGRVLESVWGTKRFMGYYLVTGLGAALLHQLVCWIDYQHLMEQFELFQQSPEPGLLAECIRQREGTLDFSLTFSRTGEAFNVQNFIDDWLNNPNLVGAPQLGESIYRFFVEQSLNMTTVGASGAVFGILLAFGMLFPNTELFIMFVPIPIKAKYFVLGYGVLELFLGLQNSAGDNVAHFAHLGGMLFGFFLILYWRKHSKRFY